MHVGETENETISYTNEKNLYLALKMKLRLETAWA